jgi:hypothetical protein
MIFCIPYNWVLKRWNSYLRLWSNGMPANPVSALYETIYSQILNLKSQLFLFVKLASWVWVLLTSGTVVSADFAVYFWSSLDGKYSDTVVFDVTPCILVHMGTSDLEAPRNIASHPRKKKTQHRTSFILRRFNLAHSLFRCLVFVIRTWNTFFFSIYSVCLTPLRALSDLILPQIF